MLNKLQLASKTTAQERPPSLSSTYHNARGRGSHGEQVAVWPSCDSIHLQCLAVSSSDESRIIYTSGPGPCIHCLVLPCILGLSKCPVTQFWVQKSTKTYGKHRCSAHLPRYLTTTKSDNRTALGGILDRYRRRVPSKTNRKESRGPKS